jgi:hypothetical protein
VRVTLQWRLVAPAPGEARKPEGFDGADPNAYPPGVWDRYDRLVRRGIGHPRQRVATRTMTGIRGYLRASVHVRGSGELRVVWNGHHSRAARFRVRAA